MAEAGRPQGSKDIAPKIRKAFALCVKRNGGISYLVDKIETSLDKDFLPTMNVLSKFCVKEKQVNHDHKGVIEHVQTNQIGDWLSGYAAASDGLSLDSQGLTIDVLGGPDQQAALPVPDGSLLPLKVCSEPEGRGEPLVIREDQGSTEES